MAGGVLALKSLGFTNTAPLYVTDILEAIGASGVVGALAGGVILLMIKRVSDSMRRG